MQSFALGYAAIYWGIARSALEDATQYCQTQVTTTAMQAVGGCGALKELPVERAYCDLWRVAC